MALASAGAGRWHRPHVSVVEFLHEGPQAAFVVAGAVLAVAVGLIDGFADDLTAVMADAGASMERARTRLIWCSGGRGDKWSART